MEDRRGLGRFWGSRGESRVGGSGDPSMGGIGGIGQCTGRGQESDDSNRETRLVGFSSG